MTDALYRQAAKAAAQCPDHRTLHGDAFHAYVRTVVAEAHAKQASAVPLLPPHMTEHLR